MPRSWSCVTAGLRRLSRRRHSTVASPHQHQHQQQPGTTLSFDLFPRLAGEDDDRTPTQTIMFLHGILGSKRNWRTPASWLAQPEFADHVGFEVRRQTESGACLPVPVPVPVPFPLLGP